MTTQLEFMILGPLQVLADGDPVDLGPARQRALLADLLLQANRVVSTDRLLDDLWGASPPASAGHALQVYVSNLRKQLEPRRPAGAKGEILLTRRPGYVLSVAAERIDASRFEAGVAEGRRAQAVARPEAASAALRRALDLWNGPALADLADETFCQGEVARLEELRLGATEERMEADLALGRHAEMVGELEVLVGRHPLRERLWGQLLVALYRCGRQADALRAYQRVRYILAEELGLEPGAALRHLEEAVLRQDPGLDLMVASSPGIGPTAGGPLPSTPPPPAAPPVRDGPARHQRRKVTAMSVQLCGAAAVGESVHTEELRLILEGAARIARDAVEAFGGTVMASSGGEVRALFGVLGAHEDDAERAIRAGLRVVEEIGALGLDVARGWGVDALEARVGVDTGVLSLRPGRQGVGEPLETAGATVAADRLASMVRPGCVLAASSTHRLTESLFEWGEARELVLDGEPLMVHQPTAARPAAGRVRGEGSRQVELVGRERELASAGEMVDAVVAGAGGVLFVSGEAGIGKTRLAAEFRRRFEAATSAGGRPLWLEGRCVSFGQSLPYLPFRELLREWLGASPHQPLLRTRVALRRQTNALFGPEGEQLNPLLASVLGLPLEPDASDAVARHVPDSLQAAIFEAVGSLLQRLARDRPVVAMVDDLQWADPTSLQLIEHLLATTESAALLLVLVGRPERDHPSWRLREISARRFGHRTSEIDLEALGEDADARMLASLLGVADPPAALAQRVLGVAEGNPFFIEELVRSLVESGALTGTEDGWRCDPDRIPALPGTVESVLVSRIDRLQPPARDVLAAASVLGRQFGAELVEAVCDPGTDVITALRELQRLDLVREVRRWPRTEYRFKHALIQEAAYSTVVEDWRRELHRRAAHGLETQMADRVAESYAVLAHHCHRAGEIWRAAAYHRLAADGARRMNAVDEALAHYAAGVGLAEGDPGGVDPETVAGLHVGRGLLRWQRGDPGAQEDLERALVLSRQTGDRAKELGALEGLGCVEAFLHGRRDEAIRRFEHGFGLAEAADDDGAAVTFANRLIIEHVNRLEFDRALRWGEKASAAADRAGTDEARARSMDGLKLVALALGDLRTLGDLAGRLRQALSVRNDLWYLRFALAESSVEAAGRGRFAASTARLEEALAIDERLGGGMDRAYFLTLRAWTERSRGSYGEALRLAREAVSLAGGHAHRMWQAWAEANLGAIHLELGSLSRAVEHLERGRAASEQAGVRIQHVRCCAHLAWAYRRTGDDEGSARMLGQAEEMLGQVTTPPGRAWLQGADAYISVARTYRALGEGQRASDLLEPLLICARASGWYEVVSGILLQLAASAAGDAAERLLREALETAQLGGLRPLESRAYAALGEVLRLGGDTEQADMHAGRSSLILDDLAGALDEPGLREAFLAESCQ